MASFNNITLLGRLTKDPESKQTSTGLSMAKFSVAVDRRTGGEKVTDFFDCTAFRQSADFIAEHGSRGREVLVSGRVEINSFVGKDDVKRKSIDIVCNEVSLVGSKTDQATAGNGAGTSVGNVADDEDDDPFEDS